MKNLFKKISALVLAAIMVLTMCSAVFADPGALSAIITINGAGDGAKFAKVHVIKANTEAETGWDFVNTDIANKYIAAFTQGENVPTAQTVIKKMIAYKNNTDSYKEENVGRATSAQIETALESVLEGVTPEDAVTEYTVTEPGVYAIKGAEPRYAYSAMAAYVEFRDYDKDSGLPTALKNTEVNVKKTPINVTKTSTDEDKVVEIGRDVNYTITATVPYFSSTQTNRSFKIKDTITGAVYKVETEGTNKDKLAVTVKIGEAEAITKYVAVNNNSFTIDLSEDVVDKGLENQNIIITYVATVTDVEVGNTAQVGVGDHFYDPDQKSKENLYTGEIEIFKTDDNKVEEKKKPLKDAGFKVYKTEGGKTLYAKFDNNKKFNGWTEKIKEATEIKTGNDGKVKVVGLDLGTYWFKEVTAPKGYSLNTNDVSVTLALNGDNSSEVVVNGSTVRVANKTIKTDTAKMTDTKLNALPSTGGMGTYLFTIVGVVLMTCAAGAFFVSRRKTNK